MFGNHKTDEELEAVFDAAMEAGLNTWDTATVYGMGASNHNLEQIKQAEAILAPDGVSLEQTPFQGGVRF